MKSFETQIIQNWGGTVAAGSTADFSSEQFAFPGFLSGVLVFGPTATTITSGGVELLINTTRYAVWIPTSLSSVAVPFYARVDARANGILRVTAVGVGAVCAAFNGYLVRG